MVSDLFLIRDQFMMDFIVNVA